MNHQIFLDTEGFIEIKVIGPVSEANSLEMGEKIYRLASEIHGRGGEVNILVDSSQEGSWGDVVPQLFAIVFKTINFRRGAIFGATAEVTALQKKVVESAGIKEKGKVFATRPEAVAWLSEK